MNHCPIHLGSLIRQGIATFVSQYQEGIPTGLSSHISCAFGGCQLHNRMEDLKGKIRVYVRVRPFSQKERDRGCQEAVEQQGKQSISVQDPRAREKKNFEFDQVSNNPLDTVFSSQHQVTQPTKSLS